jgi:hypothetical protein
MILKHRLPQTRRPKIVLLIIPTLAVLFYRRCQHLHRWQHRLIECLYLLLLFSLHSTWVIQKLPWVMIRMSPSNIMSAFTSVLIDKFVKLNTSFLYFENLL